MRSAAPPAAPGCVLVNGVAQNITLNPTAAGPWATQNVTFTFNNGLVNTIRFESNGQDLANIGSRF